MCRWMVYFGEAVVPSNLLYYSDRAFILQSEHSSSFTPGLQKNLNRNHIVNVHGVGLGWYPLIETSRISGSDFLDYHDLYINERPTIYTGIIVKFNSNLIYIYIYVYIYFIYIYTYFDLKIF